MKSDSYDFRKKPSAPREGAGNRPEAAGTPRWAARQRAQQNLPKSLRLYSASSELARQTLETFTRAASILVLDSNVVLDWLVFRDPSSRAIAAAITSRRARWITTAAMRDELEHVLTRCAFSRWRANRTEVLVQWERWSERADAPAAAPSGLRCTDPDDQKFIDLALHAGVSALLSRDRAVLKLAGRARSLGLAIQTAAAWSGG